MKRARPADLRATPVQLGRSRYVLLSFRGDESAGDAALTPAEREVVAGVIAGLTNDEIAHLRGCSPRTVANQLASIFKKLGVRSRAELAARRR